MPPVHLPTAANTPGGINPSPTTQQQKALRPSGHSAFIITYSNQQIKNPPLPPQQHQLKILQTSKYIQNDRQKDPGLPLGWA